MWVKECSDLDFFAIKTCKNSWSKRFIISKTFTIWKKIYESYQIVGKRLLLNIAEYIFGWEEGFFLYCELLRKFSSMVGS